MHFEAGIIIVRRCTLSPLLSEIGPVLGGGQSGGGRLGGWCGRSWNSVHLMTSNCGIVENRVKHNGPRVERLAGSGRQSMLG
jgi:hypothetical protein